MSAVERGADVGLRDERRRGPADDGMDDVGRNFCGPRSDNLGGRKLPAREIEVVGDQREVFGKSGSSWRVKRA